MLPARINLDVVTPERLVFSREVEEMILPGSEGYLGVRPGHTPLLAGLGIGILSWRRGSATEFMAVARGFAEVLPDRVTVLAETAELAGEVDLGRAQAALERAKEKIAGAGEAGTNFRRARAALLRAATRVNVANRRSR
ncbi:MAG: F0F1 ATP synthase subunit epsilon [Acidobacteriota bacterium]